MPNYCQNKLEVTHKDPAMLNKLVAAFNKKKVADAFHPEPDWGEIIRQEKLAKMKADAASPKASHALIEMLDLDIDIEEELAIDHRWYDWRIVHWGTKWDFGGSTHKDENGKLTFHFDTAWTPPLGVYEKLVRAGFTVKAFYNEDGVGFCGIYAGDSREIYKNEYSGKELEEIKEPGLIKFLAEKS